MKNSLQERSQDRMNFPSTQADPLGQAPGLGAEVRSGPLCLLGPGLSCIDHVTDHVLIMFGVTH